MQSISKLLLCVVLPARAVKLRTAGDGAGSLAQSSVLLTLGVAAPLHVSHAMLLFTPCAMLGRCGAGAAGSRRGAR